MNHLARWILNTFNHDGFTRVCVVLYSDLLRSKINGIVLLEGSIFSNISSLLVGGASH